MSDTPPPLAWRERLEDLAGRRREAMVVAAVVAVLVFSGIGLSARGAPPSIAPPARATPSPTSASGAPATAVVVHVAGAVRRPGIVTLAAGARVADALELAGGPLPRADLDLLNLAAFVEDGIQILVPARGSTPPAAAPATAAASPGAAVVDLNAADLGALETIPGIGPVKAAAIVAHRDEIGGFTSLDQVLEVAGIGPATLESMRPYISL